MWGLWQVICMRPFEQEADAGLRLACGHSKPVIQTLMQLCRLWAGHLLLLAHLEPVVSRHHRAAQLYKSHPMQTPWQPSFSTGCFLDHALLGL